MHEPLLAQAALPATVRLLGLELRPYSLGHELILIRENNPLLFGGTVLPKDIAQAVRVCADTFEDWKSRKARFSYLPVRWLINRRAAKCNVELAAKSFREYRESGCLELPISEVVSPNNAPTPRPPGAPFILRLHQFIVSHLRLSEAAAWDYPVGLAKMRWATHWEQEGGLNIYNFHDAEFDRFVAEQEAKGAKQCRA